MPDVVVFGSINMDLVVRVGHIPRPGETLHALRGGGVITIPGGKGANQAAAAARLGASVAMVGRVGDDAYGRAALANLFQQGVDVARIAVDPDAPTGIALITVDEAGENTIVVAAGANLRVSDGDLDAARDLLAAARWLVMQFEVPLPLVRRAIALAASLGVRVILNAAPAYAVEEGFLRGVDCLVVNESEAQAMTGLAVEDLSSAEAAAGALRAMGPATAIVTLGAQGALAASADGCFHVPARRVDVVDTTAAGDAFVGGLAASLVRGWPLTEAVRYATCAGTLATTVLGAQSSLPTRERADAFCRGGSA